MAVKLVCCRKSKTMITEVLEKMLVEFGKGENTEFVVSPNNYDILSNELFDECPIGELEYKGLKIVKMDGIEENKIYLR